MISKKKIDLPIVLSVSLIVLVLYSSLPSKDFAVPSPSFAQNQTRNNVEYNVYSNSTLGIKIEVPSNWFYKEENTQVLFIAPSTPAAVTAVSTVGIGIENTPTNSNPNALSQLAINTTKQSLANFQSISSNKTNIANNSANEIVYSGKTSSGNNAKGLLVWTVKGSKLYSINYSAVARDQSAMSIEFEKQLPIIKRMIDSFAITGSQ